MDVVEVETLSESGWNPGLTPDLLLGDYGGGGGQCPLQASPFF